MRYTILMNLLAEFVPPVNNGTVGKITWVSTFENNTAAPTDYSEYAREVEAEVQEWAKKRIPVLGPLKVERYRNFW